LARSGQGRCRLHRRLAVEDKGFAYMLDRGGAEALADSGAEHFTSAAVRVAGLDFNQLVVAEAAVDLCQYRLGKARIADLDQGFELVGPGAQFPPKGGGEFRHGRAV
jgi:hypothetical protein